MKLHAQYGAEAAAIGRPLKPIPFPALVYVLNTGSNVSYSVGRGLEPALQARMHLDIARNAVPISRELAEQFGLPLPD
jgi:hypothetical protein